MYARFSSYFSDREAKIGGDNLEGTLLPAYSATLQNSRPKSDFSPSETPQITGKICSEQALKMSLPNHLPQLIGKAHQN